MTQMTQWPAGRAAVDLARTMRACDRHRMTQMTQWPAGCVLEAWCAWP